MGYFLQGYLLSRHYTRVTIILIAHHSNLDLRLNTFFRFAGSCRKRSYKNMKWQKRASNNSDRNYYIYHTRFTLREES